MVARTSQEVQFQGGNDVRVQSGASAMANPDYNKYRKSHDHEALGQDNSGAVDGLLDSIMGVGKQLIDQAVTTSREEAYLKGAAQAGTVNSEEELSLDPFTRAWAVGGYRDTMGRLALAENDAKVREDMPKLREQSPEKFNEYLAQRRSELMPVLEGMTRKQREGSMQNLLLGDRAAIKLHSAEHTKFQIEVENRSVQVANRVQVDAMNAAKGNNAAYTTATQSAFSTVQSSIVNNEKLPSAAKAKLLTEYAEFALASDNQKLYDMFQNEEVNLPNGKVGTVASMLSWDDSVKLSKVYNESMNRTEKYRSMEFMTAQARSQADWDNPDLPMPPEANVLAFREEGIRKGFMNSDQGKAFMQDYYKALAKKANAGNGAVAWSKGDSTELGRLNKTDEEAADDWMAKFGKNLTPAQRTAELVTIGLVQGRPQALKLLGKELAPALAQLGLNPEMDKGNRDSLAATLHILDSAEKAGRTGVYSALLEALPTDQQAKLMDYRENLRSGLAPAEAINLTMGKMAEYSKMDPTLRKAMGEGNAKEDLEMLQSMEPRTLLTTIGLGMKSIVSTDAGNRLATSTRAHWQENEERVAEVSASMKFAAADELRVLSMTHPFMNKDARASTVLATLRSRTVDTANGPVLLPRGTTMQSFFGVSASTGGQRVGEAIDEFIKAEPGNRLVYSIQDGNFIFKELNKNAELVRSGSLDPKQVGPMVEAQRQREEAQARVVHGAGRTIQGITFNGENTSGQDMTQVFNTRQALLTGGIIKSSMSDKASPAELKAASDYFVRATDIAAKTARLPMVTTGKTGQEALTFFSALAVVTDGKFTSDKEYRPLLMALKGNDPAPALAAMSATPAFKLATPEQQARYVGMINKLIKGM